MGRPLRFLPQIPMTPNALAATLASAVPLSWLVANHYAPWASAWPDGLALALMVGAGLTLRTGGFVPVAWAAAIALALLAIAGQAFTGRIAFAGDAVMAALYVGAFGLALCVGTALGRAEREGQAARWVALGLLAGAIASMGVALMQWTNQSLGIWTMDLPPATRPYGNVAQPNHLATIGFLGLCALALLRNQGVVGRTALFVGTPYLIFGIAMTGSRTGWLLLGVLIAGALVFRARARVQASLTWLLSLVALLAAFTLAWTPMNEFLMEVGGRALDNQLKGGTRPGMWYDMVAAIRAEPLFGWGWQQVASAQLAVTLDRPVARDYLEHIEHSHNVVLDLLVWNGVFVGGAIIALGAWALWRIARSCAVPEAAWSLIAALGILAHGMLEFPLEYAYFLLPFGLCLGLAAGKAPGGTVLGLRDVSLSTRAVRSAAAVGAAVFGVVAYEYLQAEQNYRVFRLESARIGVSRIESPPPDLRVLTQLQAFLRVARDEPRRNMPPHEIESLRAVAMRFTYPPVMFRSALVAGLHGRPDEAARTLTQLCRIHPAKRCREAWEGWQELMARYPELRPFPIAEPPAPPGWSTRRVTP